jgi:hypothetical protein
MKRICFRKNQQLSITRILRSAQIFTNFISIYTEKNNFAVAAKPSAAAAAYLMRKRTNFVYYNQLLTNIKEKSGNE